MIKLFKNEKQDVLLEVENLHKTKKFISFIIGIMLLAVSFNVFILPLNLVNGISGVSVVLNKIIGTDPASVILIANILLIIASFTFLGKKESINGILGAILYPLFIELTDFLPNYIDLSGLETVVIAVSGSILSGIGLGMVLKAGYNSGGSDVIKKIVAKYMKVPLGKATIYVEGVIVILGLLTFGWQVFIYSIILIFIISYLTDKIMIGISDHKTFQIITEKEKEVMNFILKDLKRGVTILEAKGGYTGNKKKVLLCTVPTRQYFMVKEAIKLIDPKAFYIVTDAYEVSGGE